MEGENIPISMSVLRSGSSSQSIYKVVKSSDSANEKIKCSPYHLPRRLFNSSFNSGGSRSGKRYPNLHFGASRVPNKFSEICSSTETSNTVFRDRDRLKQFEASSSPGKVSEDCISLQRTSGSTEGFSKRPNENHRSPQTESYQKRIVNKLEQRNLEIPFGPSDHTYCRVPTRSFEHRSGQDVPRCKGLERVEIEPKVVSRSLSSKVDALHRPVCIQAFPSGSNIFFMEGRSIQQGTGCVLSMLDSSTRVCFFTLLSDRQSSSESHIRSSYHPTSNPILANSILVPSISPIIYKETYSASNIPKHVAKSSGGGTPSSKKIDLFN